MSSRQKLSRELKPGQGFWINHVHAVKDQEKFMAYAGQSIPLFLCDTFGPVVHQHVGAGATSYTVAFAALFGLESAQAGLDMPANDADKAAKAAGGMAEGEDDVVDRTVCA